MRTFTEEQHNILQFLSKSHFDVFKKLLDLRIFVPQRKVYEDKGYIRMSEHVRFEMSPQHVPIPVASLLDSFFVKNKSTLNNNSLGKVNYGKGEGGEGQKGD